MEGELTLKKLKEMYEDGFKEQVKQIIKNGLFKELEEKGFPGTTLLNFSFEISKFTSKGDSVVVEVREKLHDAGVVVLEENESGELKLTDIPPEFYQAVAKVSGFEERNSSLLIFDGNEKRLINKKYIKSLSIKEARKFGKNGFLEIHIVGEDRPVSILLPSIVIDFIIDRFDFQER